MKNKTYYHTVPVLIGLLLTTGMFAQSDNYLVLCSTSDPESHYYEAAVTLSDYRDADIEFFNPSQPQNLLPLLSSMHPRYVALVMQPLEIDVNFVREFLMISTNLDADPFSDFSYGFITGATGQDAVDFVNTIIQAETDNIEDFPLNVGGYAASSLNQVYTLPGDYMTYLNPPEYSCIYMETNDNGSGLDFFHDNTTYMENNKLLDIGHNGDPHMLWLFEGGNTDPDPPVWDYDPALIEDTAYARVGLSSYDIDSLDLYPAVAFNGACHSGVPKHVMVEGDIAATFGDTDGQIEFYDMSDDFSFALSILKTGITGYFAPCGSNNANDESEDIYNAFLYDEPLGDIHKRSNDGVVMGFLGNRPALKLFEAGESSWGCDVLSSGDFDPADWSGACYMLGGKANRIYFGDPVFDPFTNNHDEALEITTAQTDSIDDNTLEITLNYNKPENPPYFPVWDKFHHNDTRIYLPVELPEWCDSITNVQVIDSSGPYHDVFYVTEQFNGKHIFHVEVDIPNEMYSEIQYNMTLQLGYHSSAGIKDISAPEPFVLYPNPADGMVTVYIKNRNFEKLQVTDLAGKVVYTLSDNKSRQHQINLQDLPSGTYFVNLTVGSDVYTKKLVSSN